MPRHAPHKDRQLCAQVQEALYWALGAAVGDETLALLQVVAVEPMPAASRLLVTLTAPVDLSVEDAANRLGRATHAQKSPPRSTAAAPECSFGLGACNNRLRSRSLASRIDRGHHTRAKT